MSIVEMESPSGATTPSLQGSNLFSTGSSSDHHSASGDSPSTPDTNLIPNETSFNTLSSILLNQPVTDEVYGRQANTSRSNLRIRMAQSPSVTSFRQFQKTHVRSRPSAASSCVSLPRAPPSTRLKEEIIKPWINYPDPKLKWAKVLYYGLMFLGIAASAAYVYLSYRSVPVLGNICMVMEDDFSQGLDAAHWSKQVQLDGFGTGSFEWTTGSSNNSFVKDGILYIVPTLTSDSLGTSAITNGASVNLTADGTCTATNLTYCSGSSNSSLGTLINPVQSARLITKTKASIKYGKVEVTARMPTGDWLWPAIWMLPEQNVYGDWPRSGEIDIAEGRGNGPSYSFYGNDWTQAALHWGPLSIADYWGKTWGITRNKLQPYNTVFRKYTLEWNEKYLMTYVDNRLTTTMDIRFDKTFWNRGQFPAYIMNGTQQVPLDNPWVSSPNLNAPFDQEFYLILNVAVGGNFFPDNIGNKPWTGSSVNPMKDFWSAKDQWYPSWPADLTQRGMAVKSVKMWKTC